MGASIQNHVLAGLGAGVANISMTARTAAVEVMAADVKEEKADGLTRVVFSGPKQFPLSFFISSFLLIYLSLDPPPSRT